MTVAKMKKNLFLFIIVFTVFSCGGSGNKTIENTAKNNDTIAELNTVPEKLTPLKDEDLKLKGKDPFGKIIELTGEHIVIDTLIFKVSEVEIIIKDNYLVMKNRSNEGIFMLFTLPDLQLIKTFGKIGQGPDEFSFPSLSKNTEYDVLATVVESTNGKIYEILRNGDLIQSNIYIPRAKSGSNDYAGYYPALKTATKLYFAANSSTGKSVYLLNDSMQVNEIQNLALNSKRKGWANYIGDLSINMEQTRMVYAYKYFKIVKFFDLEHQTIRTLNFEKEEFDESSLQFFDGMDSNVTHYWGICSGERYVYILYSGRTPVQVWNENNKRNYYIFVEKYDWNGQPIAKYKLDRWGYFAVDEINNILYLVSTNDDDPFFIYQL
jgi:hypothetical protein